MQTKLEDDETSVLQLFAFNNDSDGLLDDGGYAVNTRSTLQGYTRAVSGLFYQRNDDLLDMIDRLDEKIYKMEDDLVKREERLFNQYVSQVQALQSLQSQSSRLSQINSVVMSNLMA